MPARPREERRREKLKSQQASWEGRRARARRAQLCTLALPPPETPTNRLQTRLYRKKGGAWLARQCLEVLSLLAHSLDRRAHERRTDLSLSLSVKSGAAAAAVTAVFVVAAPAAVVVGAVSRRPISSPLRPLPLGNEEKKASPLCLRSQFLSPFLSLSLLRALRPVLTLSMNLLETVAAAVVVEDDGRGILGPTPYLPPLSLSLPPPPDSLNEKSKTEKKKDFLANIAQKGLLC